MKFYICKFRKFSKVNTQNILFHNNSGCESMNKIFLKTANIIGIVPPQVGSTCQDKILSGAKRTIDLVLMYLFSTGK